MKKYHFELINDISTKEKSDELRDKMNEEEIKDIVQNQDISTFKFKLKKNYRRLKFFFLSLLIPISKCFFKHIKLFEQDSLMRIIWDIIVLVYILISIIYIPFCLAFGFQMTFEKNIFLWIFLEITPPYIFICDIFVTLNTAYYSKGEFVKDRYQIFKYYLKTNFLIDFVSIVPFFIIGKINLQIFFLVRIIKLQKTFRKFIENFNFSDYQMGIFELYKVSFFMLYLAHVCGCIWHYIALVQIRKGYRINWLSLANLDDEPMIIRYVNCLYYAVQTMITVGIMQTNSNTEKAFTIFICLILGGGFAYSINGIGTIFQEMFKSENELR